MEGLIEQLRNSNRLRESRGQLAKVRGYNLVSMFFIFIINHNHTWNLIIRKVELYISVKIKNGPNGNIFDNNGSQHYPSGRH